MAHVFWTECRVVYPQLCPEAAPDLVGLPGGSVALPLAGGGMHQAGALSAQEALLCPVQMQGAASASRAEEIRLVISEGFWDACQGDRLIDRLPITAALSEPEVQADFIATADDPNPAVGLAVATGPAPAPAPAFAKHAMLCHRVRRQAAMRFNGAAMPPVVSA
ncbi:MAG: hypothetical protein IPO30_20075 [Hyphomonadaceae bacterium]|nr:hypothetical protein [Hyphomonadaceae bacterium]